MPKDDGLEQLLQIGPDTKSGSFYNGEVTLYFDPELHAYFRTEEEEKILISGVTTVTDMVDKSGPLMQWAANEAVRYVISGLSPVEHLNIILLAYEKIKEKNRAGAEDLLSTLGEDQFVKATYNQLLGVLVEARLAHRYVSKEAASVGKEAHEYLEGVIKSYIEVGGRFGGEEYLSALHTDPEFMRLQPQAQSAATAGMGWLCRHKFKPLWSERWVYSRKYDFCGTVDLLGEVEACGDPNCCKHQGSCLVLADFKTSKSIHQTYRLQLAGYRIAIMEEYPEIGENIVMHSILRIGKQDADFEALNVYPDEFELDRLGFLGCLSTYNWFKQLDLNTKANKEPKAQKKSAGTRRKVIPVEPSSVKVPKKKFEGIKVEAA